MADSPKGPFTYGGVLVDIGDLYLNGNEDETHASNYLGNTHGGMLQIEDQWYIFYHRQTNRSSYARQACAEKLERRNDGGFQQAEITSCGLNQGALKGINRMFKWVAKTLILTYWNYIDRGIKRRLIDAVVQSINDWLASLATDEKIIGGRVEFNESENSTSQLAAGIVRFHIYMTPPSPMQKMDFVLEYDLSYLAALVAA